jgi:transcription elongation GreA/GreB family factor
VDAEPDAGPVSVLSPVGASLLDRRRLDRSLAVAARR